MCRLNDRETGRLGREIVHLCVDCVKYGIEWNDIIEIIGLLTVGFRNDYIIYIYIFICNRV